uniref:ubiquitinyl hydrolase 1 n=1 Tax=Caenorhabditis japonica TaxID=281687 RepID=A0A8R1HMB1_CAEJA
MRNDVYRNFVQIVFQWKEMKLFNQYKGADLIEREMTVSTRRKVELEETLNWFTTKEQLGEQDSWYCPQCKKHERATKQLDLWKLPEILILHLKRFQFTRWSREKLTWEVVVPVRGLDLTQKVANPNHEKAVYDLIAVSRHYGSLSGGHYTAIGYNDKIKKWIDFNDSCTHTMPAPPDPLESSDAYMLVYRRRKLDANGQPIDPMMSDQAPEYQSSRAKRAAARHQSHYLPCTFRRLKYKKCCESN